MDLRLRVQELLQTPKTILGPPRWKVGSRPDWREMKRTLLENGEARGASLVSFAYPKTNQREYRHLIVLTPEGGERRDGRCVCRLDFTPSVSSPHINDFAGPAGYPACQIVDPHYHDWTGNQHLGKAREIPPKLLYAREIQSRFNDINDAFWWFCEQNQIVATSQDLPEWPTLGRLL